MVLQTYNLTLYGGSEIKLLRNGPSRATQLFNFSRGATVPVIFVSWVPRSYHVIYNISVLHILHKITVVCVLFRKHFLIVTWGPYF